MIFIEMLYGRINTYHLLQIVREQIPPICFKSIVHIIEGIISIPRPQWGGIEEIKQG